MPHELPDFDALKMLAVTDPDQLDSLQRNMNDQLIDSAPDSIRDRLRGILFQIDMQRRLSKDSMQLCEKISEIMHDSVRDLRDALTKDSGSRKSKARDPGQDAESKSATVLRFQTQLENY